MMPDLSGRRALVTGSLERTGLGVACFLAQCGAEVMLHGRAADGRVAQAQKTLEALGTQTCVLLGDITEPEVCSRLAKETEATGSIDVLVNNVGVYKPTALDATDPAHWRWTFAGNLDATFYMLHAFLPQLLRHPHARVIQMGFVGCDQARGSAQATAYQIAKTGVHQLTQSVALRYAHQGLTSNTVSPGQISNSIDLEHAGRLPMGRPAEVKEIAHAVAFLASRQADYINGANLAIAGGWHPPRRHHED